MEPIRILHVVTTMDYGGVETLLMSVYRAIDRTRVQFDFLCHNRLDGKFSDEIQALGGKLFCIPGPRHTGALRYQSNVLRFFRAHPEYQIVHSHIDMRNGIILRAAKKAGVKCRISHSHKAGAQYSLFNALYWRLSQKLDRRSATARFACSEDAKRFLYGTRDDVILVKNAIDPKAFAFSEAKRAEARKELRLQPDDFVVGMVGRLSREKNHTFGISVFREIAKQKPQARLVLIGGGRLEASLRRQAASYGLADKVIFTGQFSEMGKYYAAMDVFLFPSLFEGLGIVAVEAQCSGLLVIASDRVPKEAKITERMHFHSLDAPVEDWASACLQTYDRMEAQQAKEAIRKAGYGIETVTEWLQSYYLSQWSEA